MKTDVITKINQSVAEKSGSGNYWLISCVAAVDAFGDAPRSFSMMGGSVSSRWSTSASVEYLLRLRRKELRACSGGTPMAMSTWLGASEPVVQAEPLLAQMP